MNKKFKLIKVKRGIAPIIAQILLIGLVVFAGAVTFVVVFSVSTTKPPLSFSINQVNDFQLITNSNMINTSYNSFTITIENSGQRTLELDQNSIIVTNTSSGSVLTGWIILESKILKPFQSSLFQAYASNSFLYFGNEIEIELTFNSVDDDDSVTGSFDFVISQDNTILGPLELVVNQTKSIPALNLFDSMNNTIAIDVLNYGPILVNYSIEFLVSSGNISYSLNYNNTISSNTRITGKISPASMLSFSNTSEEIPSLTVILTAMNVSNVQIGEQYFLYIWLKVGADIKDTLTLIIDVL